MQDYLITSYATEGSEYVHCLNMQRERHGERFCGQIFPDQGSWGENTKLKPRAILTAFDQSPNVLWLDADCSIDAPECFPEGDFDIGIIQNVHPTHRNRMSAGFILFRDSDATRRFLSSWSKTMSYHNIDHKGFAACIKKGAGGARIQNVTKWLEGRHKINALIPERGAYAG